MMRQVIAIPAHRVPHSRATARSDPPLSLGLDGGGSRFRMMPKKSLWALAGAVVLLLGCQEDPVGKAPGGLEPSASSQQSGERDDDASRDSGAQSGNSGQGSGGESGSGSGSGSGSAN
jgi:hypothetical protein